MFFLNPNDIPNTYEKYEYKLASDEKCKSHDIGRLQRMYDEIGIIAFVNCVPFLDVEEPLVK